MQAKAWKAIIKKMQWKASSHISGQDEQTILAFLNYDASHRKPQAAPVQTQVAMMNQIMMGRQLYATQNCDNCHTIAGKGGNVGPDLSDVGSRLSREQMAKVLHGVNPGASGHMPPLPADTSEQQVNALLDYLLKK
jgi:mono/diheme cytochrome c family protein